MRWVAQRRHPLRLPPCCQQDPAVGEANGAGGQEEGEYRCHEGEGQGDPQAALEGQASGRGHLKVGGWVEGVGVGADVDAADLRSG